MEIVSLELTKSQVVRLRLLVEYEIKRNGVLLDYMTTPASLDRANSEIEKLFKILEKLSF